MPLVTIEDRKETIDDVIVNLDRLADNLAGVGESHLARMTRALGKQTEDRRGVYGRAKPALDFEIYRVLGARQGAKRIMQVQRTPQGTKPVRKLICTTRTASIAERLRKHFLAMARPIV